MERGRNTQHPTRLLFTLLTLILLTFPPLTAQSGITYPPWLSVLNYR